MQVLAQEFLRAIIALTALAFSHHLRRLSCAAKAGVLANGIIDGARWANGLELADEQGMEHPGAHACDSSVMTNRCS
jgi:hypothetical protein